MSNDIALADYMKSVRHAAKALAEEITPVHIEAVRIENALLLFASSVLDAARFEAARDQGQP